MARAFFIIGMFLSLVACERHPAGISIPAGYVIEQVYLYMDLESCIRHAREQVEKKFMQNTQEADHGDAGFTISGSSGVGAFILACRTEPGKRATYATFLKPAENLPEADRPTAPK